MTDTDDRHRKEDKRGRPGRKGGGKKGRNHGKRETSPGEYGFTLSTLLMSWRRPALFSQEKVDN